MQNWLSIAFFIALALLVVVLFVGILNLARTDENQPTRSNKLMRMRVIVQGVVIALLVAIGVAMGAVNFGF